MSDVEIAHSGWHAEAEVVPDALLVERVRRMARVDEDVPAVVTAGAPFRAGMAITFHPARELGRDVWHIVGIGRRECWLVLDFGPAKERSASPGDASEDAPHL